MITLLCDKCEKPFTVDDSFAGKKVPCPACGDINVARSGGGITVSMGAGQGYFRMMPTLLPAVPFIVVGAACLGSVLAAVSPALRAARMRPVEALSSP